MSITFSTVSGSADIPSPQKLTVNGYASTPATLQFPGPVLFKAESPGYTPDTFTVYGIEIADLSEDVPEDYYDEIYISPSGEYTVPFDSTGGSNGYGFLKSVRIAPVDYPGQPYLWNVDFDATVSPITGDVTISLIRPGPYLVKLVREHLGIESEQIVHCSTKPRPSISTPMERTRPAKQG